MKVAIDGMKIQFTFGEGVAPLTFERERATDEQARMSAEMLGWSNKLRDAAALERKGKDGAIVTVTEQMRRDAVAPMVEHFHSGGTWATRVARPAAQNPTIAAIAAKMGISYQEAEAEVAKRMLAQFEE